MTTIVDADVPLAFWTGYGEIVLVSSHYVPSWSVILSEDEVSYTRLAPRRWLDIYGRRIPEVWEAACKAVMGCVLFHPGISQVSEEWLVGRLSC